MPTARRPSIRAVKPATGEGQDPLELVITGSHFGARQPSDSRVYLGMTLLAVVSWSDTQLRVQAPQPEYGLHVLVVCVGDRCSNSVVWTWAAPVQASLVQRLPVATEPERATRPSGPAIASLGPGQELRIGEGRAIQQQDFFDASTGLTHADLGGLIFRGLMMWNPVTQRLVPDLATDMVIEPARVRNRTTVNVVWDASRRFHDGSSVTAADVAYSYSLLSRGRDGSPRHHWRAVLDVSRLEIEVVSPTQLRLSFSDYHPHRLDHYPSLFTVPIVPRASGAAQSEPSGQLPIGSGPFRLTAFDARRITLEAFAAYGRGMPQLRRISILRESMDVLLQLADANEIQALALPDDESMVAQVQALAGWRIGSPMAERAGVLMAQHVGLRHRQLDVPDIAWNAHMWHWRADAVAA